MSEQGLDPQEYCDQMVERMLIQQRAKLRVYDALVEEGLPIPEELRTEIEDSGVRRNGVPS